MSLDGFVQYGENDEQHWVTWAWEQIKPDMLAIQRSCDTQIIGRKLAVDFVPYWLDTVKNADDPMYEVAQIVTGFRKIIFTKTLERSEWANTELAKGDLVETINQLKQEDGKDIMVVGGSSFVADLIEAALIDEYYFFLNPVVLGSGVSIFHKLNNFKQLTLKKAHVYDCGIVLLNYVPAV